MIIKERREALNLTQTQLADLIGTTQARVSQWENNITSIRSTNLIKLSKVLKISIEDILTK
jgi:transcriptional regulator with XRE-family HTH domain